MIPCSRKPCESISVEALFNAWNVFRRGKQSRPDVQDFHRNLERNIFKLYRELTSKTYRHSSYESFYIQDPKIRHIRKACVRDRLVHQALTDLLNGIFDNKFIYHVYSSRTGKGTHLGVENLERMARKVSCNYTKQCWALKCDIRKFYDSVNHEVLLSTLERHAECRDLLWLCKEVIESFYCEEASGKGLPIGNLTSQIFTNIYLNSFDRYIKQSLKCRYYVRYADDLVILSADFTSLDRLIPNIRQFLSTELKLELHPRKVEIRPLRQGIDFLGYVLLPHYRVLRTKTKKRMLRRLARAQIELFKGEINVEEFSQSFQSYLGVLSHADCHKLEQHVRNIYFSGGFI